MSSMDSESEPRSEPQRLSALYQYHNAPEVAPAHGLEFDDNVYPHSDKYPVIQETPTYDSSYKGKHAFTNDNRPPRIIFGMKVKTFMMVATVMVIVIVGAAVGGVVGGQSIKGSSQTSDGTYTGGANSTLSASAAAAVSTAAPTTSTFSAPVPTYTPLSDCPASNNTTYTSSYASSRSSSSSSDSSLIFTKHCDAGNPLAANSAHNITQAFVYSFSDCVEVCAGYNALNGGSNCSVAVYQPGGKRPSNCWVGSVSGSLPSAGQLGGQSGTDVALLGPPPS